MLPSNTRKNEFRFLPGFSCSEAGFVMGQFVEQEGTTAFVKGQVKVLKLIQLIFCR